MKCCLMLNIKGSVQGVNFRSMVKVKAIDCGVRGFVKNRGDGSVEIVAEGGEEDLKKLVSWVRNNPGFSQVEEIKEEWQDCRDEYPDFSIQ